METEQKEAGSLISGLTKALRTASTPALLHCPAKVTLTNFPRKLMEICPMLADILLYGWLCLNWIDRNHPNLVN